MGPIAAKRNAGQAVLCCAAERRQSILFRAVSSPAKILFLKFLPAPFIPRAIKKDRRQDEAVMVALAGVPPVLETFSLLRSSALCFCRVLSHQSCCCISAILYLAWVYRIYCWVWSKGLGQEVVFLHVNLFLFSMPSDRHSACSPLCIGFLTLLVAIEPRAVVLPDLIWLWNHHSSVRDLIYTQKLLPF